MRLKHTWTQQPYSPGNYESSHGWEVNRHHDERDNFYVASKGQTERSFRNDLEGAIRWADSQP